MKNRYIISFICFLTVLIVALKVGGTVFAAQSVSSGQAQTASMTTSNNGYMTVGWKVAENLFKVLAGIVAAINIIKFFFYDKQREIESITVDLVSENFPDNMCCTRFICNKIKRNKDTIEQSKIENPYNLAVAIKLSNPTRSVSHIVLRKVVFCIGEYTLKYKSAKRSFLWRKRCIVDQQNQRCLIFLNVPTIRKIQERVNIVEAFTRPQDIHMKMKWHVMNIPVFSILNFLSLKPAKVDFEEIEYQSGLPRIGIRSKSIYRGK